MRAWELKARLRKLGWWDTGRGAKHEKWSNCVHTIAVPRHKEIAEGTARSILKEASTYGKIRSPS